MSLNNNAAKITSIIVTSLYGNQIYMHYFFAIQIKDHFPQPVTYLSIPASSMFVKSENTGEPPASHQRVPVGKANLHVRLVRSTSCYSTQQPEGTLLFFLAYPVPKFKVETFLSCSAFLDKGAITFPSMTDCNN